MLRRRIRFITGCRVFLGYLRDRLGQFQCTSRSFLLLPLFVLVHLALLSQCKAQPPSTSGSVDTATAASPSDWHYQFTLFHYLLEQQGLRTLTSLDQWSDEPQRVVVVSLGQQSNRMWQREFRSSLGRVAFLVATDYSFRLPGLVQVERGPVLTEASESFYLGHPDCLRLSPPENATNWPRGINSVVLNRAGWIRIEGGEREGWDVIGRYSNDVSPTDARRRPWYVRWDLPGGRNDAPMIVLSDQSLLSNGMLWHGDNLLLALRLIEELSAGGRDRVVFVVNGRIHGESPEVEMPPVDELPSPSELPESPELPELPEVPPPPTTREILDIANTVIAKVEDADLMNEMLVDQPRRVLPPYYRRLLLVGFTGLLLAAAVYLYSLQDQRRTGTAQIALEGAGLVPSGMRKGVHYEPQSPEERGLIAQALIRDAFIQWTGSDENEVWERWIEQVDSSTGASGNSPAKHLYHRVCMDPIPPTSKEKLLSIGRDLLAMKATLVHQSRVS